MPGANYSKWKNIKSALEGTFEYFNYRELKSCLWQDEIGDVFFITKHMEMYLFNRTVLNCYCWSRKTYSQLKKQGLIFDEWVTDDGLYTFKTKLENLPFFLTSGRFKRRPYLHGNWIKSKEVKLGHRIIPFRPELEKGIPDFERGEELCFSPTA